MRRAVRMVIGIAALALAAFGPFGCGPAGPAEGPSRDEILRIYRPDPRQSCADRPGPEPDAGPCVRPPVNGT